jgi:membrane protease YdiL (CAAX protease family)
MAYGSSWKNESSRACARLPLQIFVADAHRSNGQRFVVRADEKLTAFLELESVALYSLIVSPLLFTGTLSLNLSQPNLAAGGAFNGFAAGALEEFVFRGLILSLLLSGNSDDQKPNNAWFAILISALLFSLPHAINLFAGHAEARVLAQLVWSFLLGVVFA